jgi:hypothetical protein
MKAEAFPGPSRLALSIVGDSLMRFFKLLVLSLSWAFLAYGLAARCVTCDAQAAFETGDYVRAARLFRPLADKGDDLSQTMLGTMYEMGDGVQKDYATAAAWYRKAAEQGFALAQYSLAEMYEKGRGVSQDYVQAFKWYCLAMGGYDMLSANTAARAKKSRDDIVAKMTSAQIDEGEALVREWVREWRRKKGRSD